MIVVTTPTGDIGKQVVENLVRSGGQSIRVIVRDPSRLPADVRERVEVVAGSHGDPAVVDTAFAGADTVFWLAPPDPKASRVESRYLDFTKPAVEAIQRHGVKRVVCISALGRGTAVAKNAGYVTASLAMDDLIASTGVDLRVLVMPSFMDNILRQIDSIKNQGVIFGPTTADLKLPTCATRDIAAVAARLLLDSAWSGQQEVPVLGPEDLSFNDMATIMSDVLGKPIRYQQVPIADFKAQLIEHGMSNAMAQGMVDMMVAKNEGLDNAVPRSSETGSPTSFRAWCEEVLKPAVMGN
jgi:uncharacterized protein YbjT (DUF2867 family)